DSVRFIGPLQDDELVRVFSTSHLFCMPYAYEGFGIAILEAMAFGLPAIGCRDGAAGETIPPWDQWISTAPRRPGRIGAAARKIALRSRGVATHGACRPHDLYE
ncbi:MAG: glycosyltransferase, partial [Desulfatitalea sp.]